MSPSGSGLREAIPTSRHFSALVRYRRRYRLAPDGAHRAFPDDQAPFDHHVPGLRSSLAREDADRRLPVPLYLQEMRSADEAQAGRLLRLLLVRRRPLSPNPRGAGQRRWPLKRHHFGTTRSARVRSLVVLDRAVVCTAPHTPATVSTICSLLEHEADTDCRQPVRNYSQGPQPSSVACRAVTSACVRTGFAK